VRTATFIFRVPGGLRPRHYLVTEAQKAEILKLMRALVQITPKRIHVILVTILGVIGIFLLTLAIQFALGAEQFSSVWFSAVALYILLFSNPVRLSAQVPRSAEIARVLEEARPTEQRISSLRCCLARGGVCPTYPQTSLHLEVDGAKFVSMDQFNVEVQM
jgi:hypothetical protein